MPASPLPQLIALLALPALAAIAGRRPAWGVAPSIIAVAGSATALALLPGGAWFDGAIAISGFGRGACWASLLGAAVALFAITGDRAAGDTGRGTVWIVHLLAVATVLASRSPLLLLLVILLAAAILGRLLPGGGAWRRSLAIGGLLVFAGLSAMGVTPPPLTNLATAGIVVLGFLAVVGAFPFGAAMLVWLHRAGPRLGSIAATSVGPALLTALVDNMPKLNHLQLATPTKVGLTLAGFGAVTLLVGALATLAARGWHDLAALGVLADLGLALVAVGAGGLDGAALVLTILVLTRPLMFLLEDLDIGRRWSRVAAAGAFLGTSGIPPTLGFPARLLVLGAAFRLSPGLAAVVLIGVVVELAASARVVLAELSTVDLESARPPVNRAQAVVIATVVGLSVAGGVVPGIVLSRAWGIG